MPLPILEETVAEMKLAPHEHAQTVEFPQPQFITTVVDDRVTDAETSPTVQAEMKRSSREVSDSNQRQSGGFHLSNREQTTENGCRSERGTLNQAARTWNIECLQHEIREIIFHASIKQVREMQAEAEHRKREDTLQK